MEGKHTKSFFLDMQDAFDIVWHDSLWFKLWDLGFGVGDVCKKDT